jgi:hypothetical protein
MATIPVRGEGEQDAAWAGASRIQDKRLLIVGEGVLQYLPFSALPEPLQDGTGPVGQAPLIVRHEIVTAPSASVVAVLRQEMRDRKPAEKRPGCGGGSGVHCQRPENRVAKDFDCGRAG